MDVTSYLALETIFTDWRDGDEHGWETEFDWLEANHAEQMAVLVESIREHGIREPVLLGGDGRVWDGHHRICAARSLGLSMIPVEFVGIP